MSLCYNQITTDEVLSENSYDKYGFIYENQNNKRSLKKYKFPSTKLLNVKININNLIKILKNILTDFCDVNIIGYEKRTNKYWCKKYDNNNILFHIELELINECHNSILIKFIPITGTENLIENFVLNFFESIELYKTSSFIKACLEKNCGL